MKKILIATDLSPAARNAADWGMKLAEAFDAKVVLASAFEQMPIPVTDVPAVTSIGGLQLEVQREVEQEASRLEKEVPVAIEALAFEGVASGAILRFAHARQAGWIVVGMKGNGKDFRRTFGSTVTGLARKSDLPLLIVPEGIRFSPPKAIALANDVYTDGELTVPAEVQQLADRFHSKLFVIRLFNKQSGEVIEILHQGVGGNRTIGAFSPLCELPADESVAGALNDYIAASPIDLLVMKPHPRTAPERWFLRSDTRQMIFKTHVPLLVLPSVGSKNDLS